MPLVSFSIKNLKKKAKWYHDVFFQNFRTEIPILPNFADDSKTNLFFALTLIQFLQIKP